MVTTSIKIALHYFSLSFKLNTISANDTALSFTLFDIAIINFLIENSSDTLLRRYSSNAHNKTQIALFPKEKESKTDSEHNYQASIVFLIRKLLSLVVHESNKHQK